MRLSIEIPRGTIRGGIWDENEPIKRLEPKEIPIPRINESIVPYTRRTAPGTMVRACEWDRRDEMSAFSDELDG
jgi:hypothetical protein